MEADLLCGVVGRKADARHHFGAGDEGCEDVIAAGVNLLADGEQRRDHRRAVMHAHARLSQVVQLECVAEDAVGERGERRHHFDVRAEDRSGAPRPVELRVVDNHAAPWQAGAENADADGVDDRLFRLLHNIGRDRVERQAMAECSEFTRRRWSLGQRARRMR